MALFTIPSGDPSDLTNTDILRTIDLEGTSYDFRFRWNSRDQSWSVNCVGPDGNEIFYTKATTSRVLNRFYKHRTNSPQGDLLIIDTADQGERLSLSEFNIRGRFRLLYVESNRRI